jgi:hypothetical protein
VRGKKTTFRSGIEPVRSGDPENPRCGCERTDNGAPVRHKENNDRTDELEEGLPPEFLHPYWSSRFLGWYAWAN